MRSTTTIVLVLLATLVTTLTLSPSPTAAESLGQRLRALLTSRGAAGSVASGEETAVKVTVLSPSSLRLYERFECRVELPAKYANPFDPDYVHVQGHFVLSSSASSSRRRSQSQDRDNSEATVDGFWFQNYSRALVDGAEVLTPVGKPHFRVRFTPTVPGEWTLHVVARDQDARNVSEAISFSVAADDKARGFVRISEVNHASFERQVGGNDRGAEGNEVLYVLGENVCWSSTNHTTYDYDKWFGRLSAAGGNYARLWLGPMDSFSVETTATGAGKYDLENLWRLEYVLALAERHGMYLMMCLDSFNALRSVPPYQRWADNPYNAANNASGGFLQTPFEFFTNAHAIALWQQRFRYINARFGASPHVLAWELWNEVDLVDHFLNDTSTVAQWHADQAQWIHGVDPYQHLITTSFSHSQGYAVIDQLPEMDYVQTHTYGAIDMGANVNDMVWAKRSEYMKPTYVGEFGLNLDQLLKYDTKQGIVLHNGLWASVVSSSAGTAMLWWWDNYVDPYNKYDHFTPPSRFVAGVDFHRRVWTPADVSFPNANKNARNHHLNDTSVVINSETSTSFIAFGDTGDATSDAAARGRHPSPKLLLGGRDKVPGISDVLSAQLNDHWSTDGNLRVMGTIGMLQNDTQPSGATRGAQLDYTVLLWLQNVNNTWLLQERAQPPVSLHSIAPTPMAVHLPPGRYNVSWFDTYAGKTTSSDVVDTNDDDMLVIKNPPFDRDVACKITRVQTVGGV
eukprot:TRINITY_DN52675_c0_g1_i1.p1 TRINITY_DN52675_c0_g1~~TRINITY_DN52675_c0_g1_i1.p1  ORF type:complete len:756 (+),score=307.56 TRINITY_DN52675_c0_g1_i1:51-2270(+)